MANLDVTSHFYTADGITGDVVGSRARSPTSPWLRAPPMRTRSSGTMCAKVPCSVQGGRCCSSRPRNGQALGDTIVIGYQDTVEVARRERGPRLRFEGAEGAARQHRRREGTRRRMDELKGVLGRTHPNVQTRALPESSNIARSLVDAAAGEPGRCS